MAPLATNVDTWNRLLVCPIVYLRWPESSDGKNRSTFGKLQSRCLLQTYIWSNNAYNHKVRHVVGSILINKYRSWCTLTCLKCVKKGKLCQNATLKVNNKIIWTFLMFHHLRLMVKQSRKWIMWNIWVTLFLIHYVMTKISYANADNYMHIAEILPHWCEADFA